MDDFYCEYALPCGWCEKLEKQCPKLNKFVQQEEYKPDEQTQEEYCELLPALVRSMGIETNPLSTAQINIFHSSTKNLASTLADITDSDFAKLKISQSYSKDEFITNVLKKIENLSPQERQKVYDYFGLCFVGCGLCTIHQPIQHCARRYLWCRYCPTQHLPYHPGRNIRIHL